MNKNLILDIIKLLFLIIGIVTIFVATTNPTKLIMLKGTDRVTGKPYIIKRKQKFIKYNQIIYLGFGIIISAISILSLLNIIDDTVIKIGPVLLVFITSLLNYISTKKYS